MKLTLINRSGWLGYFGSGSYTGKAVTPHSALHVGAAWACIRLLSELVSILPLPIYERRPNGERVPVREHWAWGLIHDDPNADQTAPEFLQAIVFALCLWGNFYALKERGAGGRIVALPPLAPDRTWPLRDQNGVLVYRTTIDGRPQDLRGDDVFHVRGFGDGGDLGLSPIGCARNSLGIAMATEEAAGKVFANGLHIGGLIGAKTQMKDGLLEKMQQLVEKFAGSARSGKVMVLPAEVEFKPVNMNPEDSQLLESRAWSVEEVCRWFRVPPFMIGHTEKSTSWGTGIEQQMIGFLKFSLQPYLTRIEKAINKQILPVADRHRLFAEFNVEGLLRADSKARAAFFATMTQNGIMTRNEVRAKENLPADEGGDKLTVQSAMVPLAQLGAFVAARRRSL